MTTVLLDAGVPNHMQATSSQRWSIWCRLRPVKNRTNSEEDGMDKCQCLLPFDGEETDRGQRTSPCACQATPRRHGATDAATDAARCGLSHGRGARVWAEPVLVCVRPPVLYSWYSLSTGCRLASRCSRGPSRGDARGAQECAALRQAARDVAARVYVRAAARRYGRRPCVASFPPLFHACRSWLYQTAHRAPLSEAAVLALSRGDARRSGLRWRPAADAGAGASSAARARSVLARTCDATRALSPFPSRWKRC
ncbi:hypothetical protein GGX14DRAFT_446865 [Mycena pura]|uniref:Uncharacterized protein n=1 Tax=Mycena pura TaxID=153505 RepID=A0AAD6YC18_9AGAR|nr:hypothetical protein GGX14DRAFT_446865 [Mycena pura]